MSLSDATICEFGFLTKGVLFVGAYFATNLRDLLAACDTLSPSPKQGVESSHGLSIDNNTQLMKQTIGLLNIYIYIHISISIYIYLSLSLYIYIYIYLFHPTQRHRESLTATAAPFSNSRAIARSRRLSACAALWWWWLLLLLISSVLLRLLLSLGVLSV